MYFPIAGSTFVGLYELPSYKYEDWQLLAAVPLGLAAGALALITVVAIAVMTRLAAPLAHRTILRATIGGVAFGLVGVALPLTLFTGTDQLDTVIHDGAALGAGLLIAVVFAKILVFALCEATGFIGGPFLVMLFIGGTAGTTAHVLIPGLPAGLAFTAMFAALPGTLVAAPFSLILLAALTTQIGTLQIAPVAIAVLTAYLAVSGTGPLTRLANRAPKPAAPTTTPTTPPTPTTRFEEHQRLTDPARASGSGASAVNSRWHGRCGGGPRRAPDACRSRSWGCEGRGACVRVTDGHDVVGAWGERLQDRPPHGRAPARRRDDLELTADRADAVAHPDQTVAVASVGMVHSHPVIADREMDAIPVATDCHARRVRRCPRA